MREIKKDSVMMLVPCSGDVDPKFAVSLGTMAVTSTKNGYPISAIGTIERTLVHTARNTLARNFLNSDSEWAFWMDDDMIIDNYAIVKMINFAKKINSGFISGIYYQRVAPHRPLAMIQQDNKDFVFNHVIPETDQPFRMDACGFGCVLTHRDVFKDLEWPYFRYITGEHDISEDFYFCAKSKDAGIKLWGMPEIRCGHIGAKTIIYKEDYKDSEPTNKVKLETKEMV